MNISNQEIIDECYQCAEACDHCAASCLNEEDIGMMKACIRLDIQCAAMCRLAAQFLAIQSGYAQQICYLCADICTACAEECSQHQHDHCQYCAKRCRQCADMCSKVAA